MRSNTTLSELDFSARLGMRWEMWKLYKLLWFAFLVHSSERSPDCKNWKPILPPLKKRVDAAEINIADGEKRITEAEKRLKTQDEDLTKILAGQPI